MVSWRLRPETLPGPHVRTVFSGNKVRQNASKPTAGQRPGRASEPEVAEAIAFDDRVLVRRARAGDMQAFGALVAKYQDRVFNLVYRMVGRRADAEEIAQDALLKAMEGIDRFQGNSRFSTWLYRIAVNTTISHRRRVGRVRFHPLGGVEEFEAAMGQADTAQGSQQRQPGPEQAASALERHQLILQALEELDEEFRSAVVLRDVEDLDYETIAEILNVPIGTAKSRIHRGRKALRDKLMDRIG